MANIIAIVGRPNVGKSTLFNRLIEQRAAIMDDESGVTRDRHYGRGEWLDNHFTVIDTGGYVVGSDDVFEKAIRDQVEIAISEATIIVFMTDCETGLIGLDRDFANVLRRSNKPVILAANKADTSDKLNNAVEFHELGLGDVIPIAAQGGYGTGELLDKVISYFEIEEKENPHGDLPKVAILGRPNVGKSSFLNVLLGKERSIVSDIAGTTRDSIDNHYRAYNQDFILTDTAGIRRKSRVKENIEFYSVMRSIRALENSDICILMLDAVNGLESQDMNILRLAHERTKGLVIMVNKWDLILDKKTQTLKEYEDKLRAKLATMSYVPIMFVSVMDKKRIFQTIEKVAQVFENRKRRVATSKLNDVILKEIERRPPPALKGKYIHIKYITQLPTPTPVFAFFCNLPQYIKEHYQRFLENRIRENFDFEGVPIKVIFRKK
jgi:GTP-binding protein